MQPENQNPVPPPKNKVPFGGQNQPFFHNTLVTPTEVTPAQQPQPFEPSQTVAPQPSLGSTPSVPSSSDGFQMPTAPAVLQSEPQGYMQSHSQQQGNNGGSGKKKKGFLLTALSLLVLIGGVCTAVFLLMNNTDPDKLFNTMINNSLSVTSYRQLSTEKDSDGTLYSKTDIKVDLADIKNPKSSAVYTFDEISTELPSKIETYGGNNSYLRVSTKDPESFGIDPKYTDKWIKIDTKASIEDGSLSHYFAVFADAKTNLFGHFAMGNYSDNQRQELANFIVSSKVYDYDRTQVSTEVLNGNTVLVYKATINQAKLTELNEKIAKIVGVDKDSLALFSLQGLSEVSTAKMYVDSKKAVLVKVVAETDVGTIENVYSEHGTTVLPEEPKSEADSKDAFKLDDLLSIDEDTQSNDTERKTDINVIASQLEAYYAQNGRYPTLANLNDPEFRVSNMQGLEIEALQDPDGSDSMITASPVAHSYAYVTTPAGCDNGGGGDCVQYTITATLDDGGTYVKQSLN